MLSDVSGEPRVREPSRFSINNSDDRRSPYLALKPPSPIRSAGCFGLNALASPKSRIRIVHLDAVHHGEVLIGRATANGEPAVKVLGRRHTGKGM